MHNKKIKNTIVRNNTIRDRDFNCDCGSVQCSSYEPKGPEQVEVVCSNCGLTTVVPYKQPTKIFIEELDDVIYFGKRKIFMKKVYRDSKLLKAETDVLIIGFDKKTWKPLRSSNNLFHTIAKDQELSEVLLDFFSPDFWKEFLLEKGISIKIIENYFYSFRLIDYLIMLDHQEVFVLLTDKYVSDNRNYAFNELLLELKFPYSSITYNNVILSTENLSLFPINTIANTCRLFMRNDFSKEILNEYPDLANNEVFDQIVRDHGSLTSVDMDFLCWVLQNHSKEYSINDELSIFLNIYLNTKSIKKCKSKNLTNLLQGKFLEERSKLR